MTWDDGEPTIGRVFTPKLEELLGPARRPDEPVDARHEAHRRVAAGASSRRRRSTFSARSMRRDEARSSVPRRRLRDEQRGERQDPRPRRRSRMSTSSPRPATTAPRLAPRFDVWHQTAAARAAFVMRHGYWGPQFDDARSRQRSMRERRGRSATLHAVRASRSTEAAVRVDRRADRRRQRRRLVPGTHGMGRARARQPQHPGRSAARGHARHHQHEDQVPREVPAVRAVGAGRSARRVLRRRRCTTRS